MILRRRRPGEDESLETLRRRYKDAPDDAAAGAALERILQLYPDTSWAWFNLGLRARWSRDWLRTAELNERALALEGEGLDNPSAWNLGIAATALADWRTARRAWTAYGVQLSPADDDEPIIEDFGMTPVRLNAEPRYPGEPEILIDGEPHVAEVVWCERLCPARAVVRSVPLPESGHHCGDVVLLDGEPLGERRVGESVFPVFNEIARLSASPLPTLEVEVDAPESDDIQELVDAFLDRGLGAEDWTTSLRVLCRACSEGTPDGEHTHEPEDAPPGLSRLGVSATPEVADVIVTEWAGKAANRWRGAITEVG